MMSMSSLKAFFCLLTLVSMSHAAVSLETTNSTTPEYSVSELVVENLTFEWTLKNYSLLARANSECFSSAYFHTETNDCRWLLKFCPSENTNSYSGTVHLGSHSPKGSDNIGFVIIGELSMSRGNLALKTRTFSEKVRMNGGSDFSFQVYESEIPGWHNAADEMTIRIDFDVKRTVTKRINVAEPLEQKIVCEPQEGKLSGDFGRLLKDQKYSDVEIVVGDQTLSAHELVLAARSPVFAELLDGIERNDTGKLRVVLKNMEPAVMAAVLEYLYTDDVADLGEFPSTFALLSAADEFKLPQLKTMCEEVLYKSLGADNAADILVFSDRYGLNKLKKHAMEFIRNNFPDVMETESYKKMKDKSPALLMEILFSATDKRF